VRKLNLRKKQQAAIVVLFLPLLAYAFSTGPPAGYTGAPGERNCTDCHMGTAVNAGGGSITINNVPQSYQPGQQYTINVTVQQGGRIRFGFEMTAIDSNGNGAGTFDPIGSDTQTDTLNSRQYILHTLTGSVGSSSHTWQVHWTAPSTNIGIVRFFAAGNAANNNGADTGDFIYTTNATSDPNFVPVTLALTSQIDGQVLNAGSVFHITWNVTGQANLNNVELRYSTDDGATFPISNLIATIMDPNVASFDWTVPNKPTETAKLRIQATPRTGDTVEVKTGRFTILGDGSATTKPVITSVTQSGKKVTVIGMNFQDGAVIEVNEKEFATTNSDPPTEVLKSKKAGKKIKPGQTVEITVRNPDGQRSDSFLFTGPDEITTEPTS